MQLVKTFSTPLAILKTAGELHELDLQVNDFLAENEERRIISISDSTTVDNGSTIGLIRVIAYEE